jgi:hypothetical protein
MATEHEYQHKIAQLDHAGLLALWQAIQAGTTLDWAPGKALEYLVLRAFELEGAEVRWPYSVSIDEEEIEQIDGVVYTGGISCLIECKDWSQRASVEPIAKMRNQLLRRPSAAIGAIVSIKGFTEAAEILARFLAPQTILLWNGNELGFALRNQMLCESLEAKYRYCIETGKPDFNLLMEKVP